MVKLCCVIKWFDHWAVTINIDLNRMSGGIKYTVVSIQKNDNFNSLMRNTLN